MKKSWSLFLFLFLIARCGFAADSNDYYVKDSIRYYGVQLESNGILENCQKCNEIVRDSMITYSPRQVSEYCIDGKLLYVAKDIYLDFAWKRVFLETKIVGPFTLYHYQDSKHHLFYLQRDNGLLVELPRKSALGNSYKKQLYEYTKDNLSVATMSVGVGYSMKSIEAFLGLYNGAKEQPMPKMRTGVSIGANLTKLEPVATYIEPDYRIFNYRYNPGATIGAFLDIPVFRFGLSVHAACNVSNAAFAYNELSYNVDYDFVANMHTLEFPVHLRYTYPYGNIKPYLECGGLITWNFYNTNYIQKSAKNGTLVEYQGISPTDLIDDNYIGSSIGCGLEFPLKNRVHIFMECRYEQCTGLLHPNLFGLSKLNLITGIIF